MSQRVWVVLDKKTKGDGFVEVPLLGTVARTRGEAQERYGSATPHDWVRSGGGYATDHQNGFVRCVSAILTLAKQKSKPTKRRTSR